MKTILRSRGIIACFSQGNIILMLPNNFYVFASSCFANWALYLGPFSANNEQWLLCTESHATGTRVKSFCDAVRSRDSRCVISIRKILGTYHGRWTGFKTAHIFPLPYEGYWNNNNYSRWITIAPESGKGGSINSVKNSILLNSAIHQLFDSYELRLQLCSTISNYIQLARRPPLSASFCPARPPPAAANRYRIYRMVFGRRQPLGGVSS
jgi:hypothetical protein